jgi:hypothetical protein
MRKKTTPIFFVLLFFIFSCITKSDKKEQLNKNIFVAKADSLITITFDTLRNSLLKAIIENNYEGAITFCKEAASPLINTYTSDGIIIRRTSEKYRNPSNKPDSMEQRILASYQQLKNSQQAIEPIFEEDKQKRYHYFKPIIIQAMCLNCHGSKTNQIQPAVWQSIQQEYPADLANDYKEGDLRGMWHITFSKNNP